MSNIKGLSKGVKLVSVEFNTAVKYVTRQGFVNDFPITFEYKYEEYLRTFVGFKQREDYTIVKVNGVDCVRFNKDLAESVSVTIRRITPSGAVPHTYQYNSNAQGGAEFSAKTMDENFAYLSDIVEEVEEYNSITMDSLSGLEASFNDVRLVAEGAKIASEGALEFAEESLEIALGIDGKAQAALDTSEAAKVESHKALTIAQGIDGKAQLALDRASKAEEGSTQALSVALGVDSKAQTALDNSRQAVSDSSKALEVSLGINSKAQEALDNSQQALKDIDNKRDLSDNVFNGYLQVRSEQEDQRTGVFLQDTDGTVIGQVVATEQGLQLTQYPKDGGSQAFTFPSEGDGGELIVDNNLPYVTPEMFGAVGDGVTDDTSAVSESLNLASISGKCLRLSRSYKVSGGLQGLWSVTIVGEGSLIKESGVRFTLSTSQSFLNVLYVNPDGDDLNDGLTPDSPLKTIQKAFDILGTVLLDYVSFGRWRVQLSEGVFANVELSAGYNNRSYLELVGTRSSEGDYLSVITSNDLDKVGVRILNGNKVLVKDLHVKDFKGVNGQGITGEDSSDVYCVDVKLSGMGWAGGAFINGGRVRFQGGSVDNCRVGLRAYGSVTFTFGYNSSQDRTIINNCITGVLAQNSANGHVDFTEVVGCSVGVFVVNQSRVHLLDSTIVGSDVGLKVTGTSNFIESGSVVFEDNKVDKVFEGFSLPNSNLSDVKYYPTGGVFEFNSTLNKNPTGTYTGYNFNLGSGKQWLDVSGDDDNCGLRFVKGGKSGGVSYRHDLKSLRLTIDGQVKFNFNDSFFDPAEDNSRSLGTNSNKWSNIYSHTGVINTSDSRSKKDISSIPDEVLDAWEQVNFKRYRFKEGLRWHFGAIAQDIVREFSKFGVDACDYGLLCKDTWEDPHTGDIKERYGVRYDEALVLESALLRREVAKLKAVLPNLTYDK